MGDLKALSREQILHDLVMLMLAKSIEAENVDHSAEGYMEHYSMLMHGFEKYATNYFSE